MMKVKIVRLLATVLLIFGLLRFFANLFLGEMSLNTAHHLFFNLLWIIAATGLLKMQKWGRLLTIGVSVYYVVLFCILLLMTSFDGRISDITFHRIQGFVLAVSYIIILNIRSIKEIFSK